jgi:hypothetical membrane protein
VGNCEAPPARQHKHFLTLLAINTATCVVATLLYPEKYVIAQHALSDFGATVTRDQLLPNPIAPWVFGVGMVVSAVWMFGMPAKLDEGEHRRSLMVRMAQLCAIGFLFMVAPHNLPLTRPIHMTGGACIFFSLWAFAVHYLVACRRNGQRLLFLVGMLILQASVLFYAVLFVVDSPAKQAAQAIALVGVILPLLFATRAVSHASELEVEPVA